MRIQALKKASKERERRMLKESELLRAKRELEALRNKHQKLCNKVQKYSIFNKYLEDVVKISQVSFDMRETDHGLKEDLTWVFNLEEIRQVQGNHNTWSNPMTSDGMRFPATKVS